MPETVEQAVRKAKSIEIALSMNTGLSEYSLNNGYLKKTEGGSLPLRHNFGTTEESNIDKIVEEKLRKKFNNLQINSRENTMKYYNCGKEGHKARECQKNRNYDNNGRKKLKCFNCQKEGHIARDCKSPPNNSNTPTCRYCKRIGHVINDCRKKQWDDKQRDKNQRQNMNRNENEENQEQNQYLNDQSHLY